MMKGILIKTPFFRLILFLFIFSVTAGCKKKEEQNPKELLCSYIIQEKFEQIEPIVNDYLSSLSEDLRDEIQLHSLATWLNSCTCIDGAYYGDPSPPTGVIDICLAENEMMQHHIILLISLLRPLQVIHISYF